VIIYKIDNNFKNSLIFKIMSTPQLLTEKQLDEICNAIPINRALPPLVAQSIIQKVRTKLCADMKTVKIYPEIFPKFKDEIVKYYHKTMAQAGEAVGIITAQSIGERQTQTTLNSLDWNEKIIVNVNGSCVIEPIGQFIDRVLDDPKNTKKVDHIPENRTEYFDTTGLDLTMPSVDENGMTSWLKVEAITRHLPVGKLVKIKTESGREVSATQSKSFLVWDGEKFSGKNGSDIKVGDIVPTCTFLQRIKEDDFLDLADIKIPLTMELGKRIGQFLSDKEDEDDQNGIKLDNDIAKLCMCPTKAQKIVPSFAFFANKYFQEGLINGFFGKTPQKFTVSSDLFDGIRFISTFFGIQHRYQQEGFPVDRNVYFDKIVSLEYVDASKETVYDFTIEKTRTFLIFNGLCVNDTFHSAGLTIKSVVVGVPRFSELLNATKDPKMVNCLIYLTEPFTDIAGIRKRIGNSFTEITLKRLYKSSEFIKEPLEKWHYLFCDVYNIDASNLGWRIRFELNKDVVYEYQVTMRAIKEAIEEAFPTMTVLYTPESKGIIDVFIDEYRNEKGNKEEDEEGDEIDEEEPDEIDDDIKETDDVEEEEEDEPEEDEPEEDKKTIELVHEELEETYEDDMVMIEDKIIPQLLSLQISGIKGVNSIFFEKRKNEVEEWVITTEGSNLYGFFADPLVDKKRSLCNNMWEINTVFGIEATRQFLIEEFMDVVTSDGTFVNSSHVELLVDLMVYTGSIISISRYGQKKVGSGPLSKASFEESLENFLKAGLNSEKETTDGVSASIMLGKIPKTGTGMFDLKMDIEAIIAHQTKPVDVVSPSLPIPPSVFKVDGVVETKIESAPQISSKKFKKANSLFA
jgi:DNA-directed RNA polymerase beta' subunit